MRLETQNLIEFSLQCSSGSQSCKGYGPVDKHMGNLCSHSAGMDGHKAMRSQRRVCLTPRDIPSRKEEHAQGHRGLNKCVTAGFTQWFPAGKQQGARATQESLSLS